MSHAGRGSSRPSCRKRRRSVGLATYQEDGNTVATILRAADTMMYEAKITRDSVVVSGKGTVSKAAKSESDSGPRAAVAGMFLERD